MQNIQSKVCNGCGIEKPVSEFYKSAYADNPTVKSYWTSECKKCMRARSRNSKRKHNYTGRSTVPSEELCLDMLHKQGIYVVAGGVNNLFPDVDLIAWGCIAIEVKFSKLVKEHGKEKFKFVFSTPQYKRGLKADLVILVCEHPNGKNTFHIFDAMHDVFYMDGRLKTGFTFTPGQYKALKHGNSRTVLTQTLMDKHENAWYLIEEKRKEKSRELIEGDYTGIEVCKYAS